MPGLFMQVPSHHLFRVLSFLPSGLEVVPGSMSLELDVTFNSPALTGERNMMFGDSLRNVVDALVASNTKQATARS